MLRLDAKPQLWVTHDDSGCEFLIGPITPRDNQKLLKAAKDKKGEIDYIVHNGLTVDFCVVEWKHVGGPEGELPPTEENKKKLGEKFPSIANFLFRQATDIKMFCDEVDAAKND